MILCDVTQSNITKHHIHLSTLHQHRKNHGYLISIIRKLSYNYEFDSIKCWLILYIFLGTITDGRVLDQHNMN